MLRNIRSGGGQIELLFATEGTHFAYRLKHTVFDDDVVSHHTKRICGRMRANHLIMLIDHNGSQRKHGKQRIGGIIQCVIIGIMLIIVIAVRQ